MHELGHVFEARINTAVRDNEHARNQLALATNIDRRGINPALEPNSGFAGSFSGWQQSTVASTGEELADMYIGWTYGQWDDTTQGRARSTFMLQHMSGWISLFR